MAQSIPTVSAYMTAVPQTVDVGEPLGVAYERMCTHQIRHLVVTRYGKLAGIVSDRDLALVEALRDVAPEQVTLANAMSDHVFAVEPDAPLDEVVGAMADGKLGSAVVVSRGQVIGILTTVDVCRAFVDLLHRR